MAGRKSNPPKQHARKPRPEKRPPLTHFLCIPLVNPESLPQLEASIRTFRSDYPPIPVADLPQSRDPSSNDQISQPLIPEGAVRPLGTLHLTLGVMSLPSKERLDEALNFFHSLDLPSLLHEAERVAAEKRGKHAHQHQHQHLSTPPHEGAVKPLTASLESLHALPRAKAATILHAAPVDPTDRLYPFCLMLRGKFLEAGFIVGETEKPSKGGQNNNTGAQQAGSQDNPHNNPRSESSHHGVDSACAPKLRPLLLHATIANTIYVRGRLKPVHGPPHTPRDRDAQKRIVIDAREVLERYNHYYTVEERRPRQHSARSTPPSQISNSGSVSAQPRSRYPFVWAKDIPLDSVCICEMGAKKLAVDGPDRRKNELHKRLGEKYIAIAERSILGSSRSESLPTLGSPRGRG